MVDMGITDKQFNGFVRFLLDALKDAMETQRVNAVVEGIQLLKEKLGIS